MAKGNIFWSQGRGRLGDMVLAINKGQVIQRKYQAVVSNPRTEAQQAQRARFANAVKFYKRAYENFFKFAYEDKKQNETDYNAFMRHNTNAISAILKREQVNGNFPALGNAWMISSGSMQADPYVTGFNGGRPMLEIPNIESGATTIGQVSQGLIDDYYLQAGDIVTFVRITSLAASLSDEPTARPVWEVAQFIVNVSDTTLLADLKSWLSVNDGYGVYLDTAAQTTAAWYGVVFSRRTSSGLKVTDSYLYGNAIVLAMWNAARDEDWISEALATWDASSLAILEGALAGVADTTPVITSVSPSSAQSIASGASVTLTITGANLGDLSASDFSSNNADLAITSYTADSAGTTATLVLTASAAISSAEITYDGNTIFEVANTVSLTVATNPATGPAGTATINGVDYDFDDDIPVTLNLTAGSSVTIRLSVDSGYEFVRWSDGSTSNPYTFTISEDTTLTAQFSEE